MKFLPILLLLAAGLWMSGCANNGDLADAYGTFEAPETLISAEASGRLLHFDVNEGDVLTAGQVVGVVDTTQLVLQRAGLEAKRQAIRARTPGIVAQIDVLQEQKRVAEVEHQRLQNLFADQAATQQQLDDLTGRLSVLDRQIEQIRTQHAPLVAEIEATDAQIAQVNDLIARSTLTNPIDGTVLVTFAQPHEVVAPGKPLYKIADLSSLDLRAYVSGAQLPHLRLGQTVEVQIDESATENRTLSGEITWIAADAEFTPKIIQTKEERVNLVYALKVRVPNPDGALKIGMPGEVWVREE